MKMDKKQNRLLTQLAKEYQVNIVGGSVATKRDGKYFNTMYVVNRTEKSLHNTIKPIYLN